MKKIISLLTSVLFILVASAQITIDSSRMFKAEGYVGILVGPQIGVDSGNVSGFATLRAGANVYWVPKQWFTLTGIGSLEINEKGSVTPFYLIGMRFKLHRHVVFTVGKIGTPMTELRPLPNTSGGQFEPWTKQRILPSATGGKVTFLINDKSSIVAGTFWRGKDITAEIGAKTKFVQMAGYYQIRARTFGGAISLDTKYVSQTFVYNHRNTFGSVTVITIPKTAGVLLYSDIGFRSTDWKWIRGEWGVLKTFQIKFIQGLVGMGYAYETKSLYGYLQISL
jgi:hypothetical protein